MDFFVEMYRVFCKYGKYIYGWYFLLKKIIIDKYSIKNEKEITFLVVKVFSNFLLTIELFVLY